MKKKSKIVIMSLVILIVLLLTIIIICLNLDKHEIVGTWTIDNVTIYKFDKNMTGKLKVSLNVYEFTYRINNDKLLINYQNDKFEDVDYTFKIVKNKLYLYGDNGDFVFDKISK